MAAEFSSNAKQTVASNQAMIFTETPVPCNQGLVNNAPTNTRCSCGCRRIYETLYLVEFHGNISLPTTPAGTVEPISLAITIDGATDPSSIMTVTVPLVSDIAGDNVGTSIIVAVPSLCGCESISVTNISTQAINVMNANLIITYQGVRRIR